MASKAMWLVILLFICLNSKGNQAFDSNLSIEEDLELEMQLKVLNKPPITTFQSKEGDIIDCVDINNQPALDHPLLKNHKVQIQPSRYPFGWSKDSSQSNDDSLMYNNNREPCPIGSVPIRRTLKKDLIRLRSISLKQPTGIKYYSPANAVKFPYNQNVVSLSMEKSDFKYYGAAANISVYNLTVAQDQSSSSNIWIVGGSPEASNVIIAGWQVNPAINGDSLPRTFGYWTADGAAKTGCYNTLCPGFVQVDRSSTPTMSLSPSSIYEGQQYDYSVAVFQDDPTGNWWLLLGENHTSIGYWPKELFGYLNGADQVAWGGIAKPSPNGNSPVLGNGHMPNGKFNEACYFRTMNYIKEDLDGAFPVQANTIDYVSNTNCYNLVHNMDCGIHNWYYCFTFGGPGGNNCRAN